MEQKLEDLLEWVINNYSFIIKGKGEMDGNEFAKHIKEYYKCGPDTQKNCVAYTFAKSCISSIKVTYGGKVKVNVKYNFG